MIKALRQLAMKVRRNVHEYVAIFAILCALVGIYGSLQQSDTAVFGHVDPVVHDLFEGKCEVVAEEELHICMDSRPLFRRLFFIHFSFIVHYSRNYGGTGAC